MGRFHPLLKLGLLFAALLSSACASRTPAASEAAASSIRMGASMGAPASPSTPSWGNGQTIYTDPANSTGCASNRNSCFSATCGAAGVGPCLNADVYVQRWGSLTPYFTLTTAFVQLSTYADPGHPIILTPIIGPNPGFGATMPTISYSCSLGTPTALTLTAVTSKNRATNTPLSATFSGSVSAPLLVNNTTHSSFAWTYSGTTGTGPFVMSQPFAPQSISSNGNPPTPAAEVDTWASTDNVNVYTPLNAWIVKAGGTSATLSGLGTVWVGVNCLIPEYLTNAVQPGDDAFILEENAWLFQANVQRHVTARVTFSNYTFATGIMNSALDGGFGGGLVAQPQYAGSAGVFPIWGGYVSPELHTGTGANAFNNVVLDGDVAVYGQSPQQTFTGYNYVGFAMIGNHSTTNTALLNGGVIDLRAQTSYASGTNNALYGFRGALDVARGVVFYPAGAGAAAASLLISNGIKLENQANFFLQTTTTLSTTSTALSVANLDTNLGTTSGCALFGGSGFCNVGP